MCSSDVPGGVSTIKTSRSPQLTLSTNCLIMEVFFGPRHMTCSAAGVWSVGASPCATHSPHRLFGIREQKADGHDDKTWVQRALDGQPPRRTLKHLLSLQPCHHRNAANDLHMILNRKQVRRNCANLGPQRSMSRSPTLRPLFASPNASCTDTVLFPTPPLPDNTSTQCLKGMGKPLLHLSAANALF